MYICRLAFFGEITTFQALYKRIQGLMISYVDADEIFNVNRIVKFTNRNSKVTQDKCQSRD